MKNAPEAGKTAPVAAGVWTTRSERGTRLLARRLAYSFRGDEIVFLIGELGAGKTVFAKGIAAGLGMKNSRLVCSPSFTLINVYQARVPILHLDLYRLVGRAEIRDLGFEDSIGEAVILIEWGERIDFPLEGIHVHIDLEPDGTRRIRIERPAGRRKPGSPKRRATSARLT
ncbi:MAG: tRNA (adenosine(37)-N6)-threonylcarbamoyltransferase complex ATPase subunit type 1 TsaE [Candidatus Aminicenantes bacterium]|nr:tRNA (adenosine(37)-N6)-threonylcarbamoyltransferase complex ATPase subunit type 1 TsaE [Candidatus Aminicenantes bacterium]